MIAQVFLSFAILIIDLECSEWFILLSCCLKLVVKNYSKYIKNSLLIFCAIPQGDCTWAGLPLDRFFQLITSRGLCPGAQNLFLPRIICFFAAVPLPILSLSFATLCHQRRRFLAFCEISVKNFAQKRKKKSTLASESLSWLQTALFKKFSWCAVRITQSDELDLCLLFLGEGHNVTTWKVCQGFTPKARGVRASEHKTVL